MFNVGFYFIPGALRIEEQCHWIRESLTSFPEPPNRTNHDAIYGPIHELFTAAIERKVLVEEESRVTSLASEPDCSESKESTRRWKFSEENSAPLRGNGGKSVSASVLLRKLRWSTLGLQFDWSKVITSNPLLDHQVKFRCRFICSDLDVEFCDSNHMFGWSPSDILLKRIGGYLSVCLFSASFTWWNLNGHLTVHIFVIQRNYDVSLPHNQIPDALCLLAKRMAAPAMPKGEEFKPEAAIVNYFGSGNIYPGSTSSSGINLVVS